jgi:phosphate/sulfate permease
MKNTSKIGLITIILIALSIGIGAFTFQTINAISDKFDKNAIILISAIVGIAWFIVAIAANLIAFFITYFCDQKYMNEKQCEAFDIIKEIDRHTKKQYEAFDTIKKNRAIRKKRTNSIIF